MAVEEKLKVKIGEAKMTQLAFPERIFILKIILEAAI